jgi:hypothetical protein
MIDPEIAKKASMIDAYSTEARYVARALGKERLSEILRWARSQGLERDFVEATRRLVEIGLKVKKG